MSTKWGFQILFILIMVFLSCTQKESEWKGTIEEKDGVVIVKNPKEPIYGEEIFYLEEDLSIGESEENKDYSFARISDVTVDQAERVYVTDSLESHVKVFDKNGDHLRTIGRPGQGPGEFNRPRRTYISHKNEIVVIDKFMRRLNYFSMEGEYIKSDLLQFQLYGYRCLFDSKGNIIGDVWTAKDGHTVREVQKLDSNYNLLFVIDEIPLSPSGTLKVGLPSVFWQISQQDQIIYGDTTKYEFKMINPGGTLVKKIIKEYEPEGYTAEEKEQYLKNRAPGLKIEFSKYRPVFYGFIVNDQGYLIVNTFKEPEDRKGYFFEVFGEEGRYIAKIVLPNIPYAWKHNKIYTLEEDKDGFQVIKRYKAIWKIKE